MRFVCEQAGVALSDVEAVAVDHGPGLYTGLRAGLATAKATAAALGIDSCRSEASRPWPSVRCSTADPARPS